MSPVRRNIYGRPSWVSPDPREALSVVMDAQPFARATPAEVVFLHLLTAEAALACEERALAAEACRDFHQEVERLGRDHFVSIVSPENFVPSLDPFARIHRVESTLESSSTQSFDGRRAARRGLSVRSWTRCRRSSSWGAG